ncbi:hypothetical protein HaLaN_14124 [Haematococcus lacustris]|uniref:Uncharacterized protein n=1 Tax=Haematococcus lacustris TaxID=44745 RepID=A0A699Z7B8_HAELA|nr:hypothetical protein HaLaN_14124 [Haematococcus lacustris]
MARQTDVTTPLHPCSEISKAAALLDLRGVGSPGAAPAPAASCCQGGAAGGVGSPGAAPAPTPAYASATPSSPPAGGSEVRDGADTCTVGLKAVPMTP